MLRQEHLIKGTPSQWVFCVQLQCFLLPAASQHILYIISAWPLPLTALGSFGLFKRVRFEDETHFPTIFACMQEYRSLSNAIWPCSWLSFEWEWAGWFLWSFPIWIILQSWKRKLCTCFAPACFTFSSSMSCWSLLLLCILLPSAAHRAPAWPSAALDHAHIALYDSSCSAFPSRGTVVLWNSAHHSE